MVIVLFRINHVKCVTAIPIDPLSDSMVDRVYARFCARLSSNTSREMT